MLLHWHASLVILHSFKFRCSMCWPILYYFMFRFFMLYAAPCFVAPCFAGPCIMLLRAVCFSMLKLFYAVCCSMLYSKPYFMLLQALWCSMIYAGLCCMQNHALSFSTILYKATLCLILVQTFPMLAALYFAAHACCSWLRWSILCFSMLCCSMLCCFTALYFAW